MTTPPEMPLSAQNFRTPPPPREVAGHKLILDPGLVDRHEDWTQVRSRGRARRREKKGHRQRVRRWTTPRMDILAFQPGPRNQFPPQMVMHPSRWPSFALELAQQQDFLDRAARLSLDQKTALQVQKQWRMIDARSGETLIRSGRLQIILGDRDIQLRSVFDETPTAAPYRSDLLETLPLRDGHREGWAVVWRGLILDQIWL